jgi:hypothetical protein
MFEYIDNINRVSMESQMDVCDSIINLIDKYEAINEYNEESSIGEIVMESMLVFMEYVSKDKDEITKWMAKNGHFYEGKDANKKKRTLRMYNFLKQHKFDPKDSTYESDIETKDGKKKRIKLRIDYGSEDLKDSMDMFNAKKTRDTRKLVSPFEHSWQKEVNSGVNASSRMDPDNPQITMGSKEMKGKQSNAQFTLKHEEGHAASALKNGKKGYKDEDAPEIREKLDAYKKEHGEKALNSHDDSVEEIKADEYGAKHARVRTKNAGSVRKFKDHDIDRIFLKETKMLGYVIDDYRDSLKSLKNRKKALVKLNKITDITDAKHMKNILFMFNIDNGGRGEDGSKIKEITDNYIPKLLNGYFVIEDVEYLISQDEKRLKSDKQDLSEYEKALEEKLKDDPRKTTDPRLLKLYKSYPDRLERDIKRFEKSLGNLKDLVDLTKRSITRHTQDIAKYKKEIEDYKRLSNDPEMKKRLNMIDHMYKKKEMTEDDKEAINALWKEIKGTGYIEKWIKELDASIKKCEEDLKDLSDVVHTETGSRKYSPDTSSAFRNMMAKEVIREYFEDLFGDDEYYTD